MPGLAFPCPPPTLLGLAGICPQAMSSSLISVLAILSYQAPLASTGRRTAQAPDLMKDLHQKQNAVQPRSPLNLLLSGHGATAGILGVSSVADPAVL